MKEPEQPRRSLAEVSETVPIPRHGSWLRKWLAILGPALMVAVGYMDPGNWATDLAAGAIYNYRLIWVLLMSNLMAILLQSLAARLGVAGRRDLAQACHEEYPPAINIPLYILCEIAIAATDLAEVLGSAIALQILLGLPLVYGVLLTGLDALLLLAFSRIGIRKIEAVVISLVATIGVAMVIELFLAKPDWPALGRGFVPSLPDGAALYLAIGILGATVMPHNLYLHSALVQTRRTGTTTADRRAAIKWNNIDSAVSLNLAFFVNAALLVLAAAVFYRTGHHEVAEIQDAHRLLQPLLGAAVAPIAFAVALLASGQSSTITGTLAGQIVMEGFINLRIRPWLRRLITRVLAIGPAMIVILRFGEGSTGGLLVLSQVVLSLQLPFAIVPLVTFVSDRRRMGEFAIGRVIRVLAWIVAAVVIALNGKLLVDQLGEWIRNAGPSAWLVRLTAMPMTAAAGGLLLMVALWPLIRRTRWAMPTTVHPLVRARSLPALEPYRKVVVAVDFSGSEHRLMAEAIRACHPDGGTITLLHVVESALASLEGREVADLESGSDRERLEALSELARDGGRRVNWRIGAGKPADELASMIGELDPDLVILGGHGHGAISDLVRGTTVEALRHRIRANLLVVPPGED